MYPKMEQKLQKIFGHKIKISFVRFFESKKNQVALVAGDWLKSCNSLKRIATLVPVPQGSQGLSASADRPKIIIKSYIWGDRQKEEKILKKLSRLGIAAPRVIKSAGDILFMEYIEGENLRHLYNKLPDVYCKDAQIYDALIARWLGNFHKAFKNNVGACHGMPLLKGDMRLQNFICTASSPLPKGERVGVRGSTLLSSPSPQRGEGRVRGSTLLSSPSPQRGEGRVRGILYGVDFEESRPGAPEEDIAELFAVFLTQIIRTGGKSAGQTFRFADIKKYRARIKKFIKIYNATVGTEHCSVLTKNIDSLVKQNLLKISEYLPHLKDNINEVIRQLGDYAIR